MVNYWHIMGYFYFIAMFYIGINFMYNLGQAPWIVDNFWNNIVGILYIIVHIIAGYGIFFRQHKEVSGNSSHT